MAAWTGAALLGAERRRVDVTPAALQPPRPDAEAPARMAVEAQSLTIAFAAQPRTERRVVVNAANWDPLNTAGESVDDDSLDGDAATCHAGSGPSGCSVRTPPRSRAGEEATTELRIGRVYWSGALG